VIGSDGTIYAVDDEYNSVTGPSAGPLYAIRPDGTLKWKFATGDGILSSPVIGADGTIYLSSKDLFAINPNGINRWVFASQWDFDSSPTIGSNGTIYVGDDAADGATLYAINPNGTKKWQFATGGCAKCNTLSERPTVGTDGIVYWIGTWDRTVYAIGEPVGTENPVATPSAVAPKR
jgi:outer membrane protein assembly factor BamB